MHDINGTCYAVPVSETPLYGKECPSYENVLKSKKEYAVSVRIEQDEQDHIRGKLLETASRQYDACAESADVSVNKR